MTTSYVNDIIHTSQIIAISCGTSGCGLIFGLSAEFMEARQKDHRTWYCPNGHPRHYPAPKRSQEDFLRAELEAARSLAQRESNRRRTADYQARAYKGHATRLRNRIAQGFCPAGCDQQFPDVHAHLAAEHPDFHLDGTS